MSKTIEEIKAKRLLKDYIESKNNQIKELQDQNAELVGMLNKIKGLQPILEYHDDFGSDLDEYVGEAQAIKEMFDSIDILLTKYNHLKSNTNETDMLSK